MRIILALIIFSAIVLIHEFGHFLFAKLSGIKVVEFSLGMGPRILSKQIGETRYSWKALPLGGSCAMLGEDTDEETLKGSFNSAPILGRIATVAAGPIFNFLLAFVLSAIIVGFMGYCPAEVMSVEEGSAAEAAGLRTGDIITEFQGYKIDLGKDLYVYSYLNALTEDEISMKVLRDGEIQEISYMPDVTVRYLLGFNRTSVDTMEIASLIPGMALEEAGLQPGDVITQIDGVDVAEAEVYDAYIQEHPLTEEPRDITYVHNGLEYYATVVPGEYRTPRSGFGYNIGTQKVDGIGNVVKYGAIEVKYMIRTTLQSLKGMFTGKVGMEDMSGPVGVVDAIGETYEVSKKEGALIVWMNMLNMAVMLSANLGVMNLLPIPALDGGRLVFLVLEAIRKKPINRNW
ncbi:MAG: RIP metalloprotease RseP, partial [Clostridiales bacterium]|nr:RIP metalloprotease RseP [Candidatus Blautia equi]